MKFYSLISRCLSIAGYILLTIFYFTFVLAAGLAVRVFQDPLALRLRSSKSYWLDRDVREVDLKRARQRF